ncbi:hypothetical protein [Curvibacter phage PCA1]|nr:hypothetical protein [Curvibacter phage PCA1]
MCRCVGDSRGTERNSGAPLPTRPQLGRRYQDHRG